MIPTFVLQIVGTLVRSAVLFSVGWLAAHGGPHFTNDEVTNFIAGSTPALAMLAWSIYEKFRNQQKLLVAQASSVPVSEAQVKSAVMYGLSPSVLTPSNIAPTMAGPVGPPR